MNERPLVRDYRKLHQLPLRAKYPTGSIDLQKEALGKFPHHKESMSPKELYDSGHQGGLGMRVMNTNRFRRATYLVLLLVFAVALSTALLLAADRQTQGTNKSNSRQESNKSFTSDLPREPTEWA